MPTDETSQDLSDEQIDHLVERSETSSNREIPMTQPEPQEALAPKVEEFEFDQGGKKYKATRDQVIAWAKQGINYPQKIQSFNQERTKWEQDRQNWEKSWGSYRQIDEWAKQHPDKWEKLNSLWSNGQFGSQPAQGQSPGQAPELDSFKKQLVTELNQTLQPIFQEREEAKLQKASQDLDKEISSIREKFKDIDFDSTGEDGRTIEKQILDFAIENKIPKFEVAAKAFLHDQILANAQAQAKLEVSKGIQRDTKMGILGKSPIPQKAKGFQQATNVRNRSYNDLEAEALEEIRSMKGA